MHLRLRLKDQPFEIKKLEEEAWLFFGAESKGYQKAKKNVLRKKFVEDSNGKGKAGV